MRSRIYTFFRGDGVKVVLKVKSGKYYTEFYYPNGKKEIKEGVWLGRFESYRDTKGNEVITDENGFPHEVEKTPSGKVLLVPFYIDRQGKKCYLPPLPCEEEEDY